MFADTAPLVAGGRDHDTSQVLDDRDRERLLAEAEAVIAKEQPSRGSRATGR
jgi:hypothetical protein